MATLTQTTPYAKGGLSDVRAYFNDNLKIVTLTVVPSGNYATGGDTVVLPTGVKDWIATGPTGIVMPLNGVQSLYTFGLDTANSKLKAFTTTTMAEVSAATNIGTLVGTNPITFFFLVR